jgi:hypothetical protein
MVPFLFPCNMRNYFQTENNFSLFSQKQFKMLTVHETFNGSNEMSFFPKASFFCIRSQTNFIVIYKSNVFGVVFVMFYLTQEITKSASFYSKMFVMRLNYINTMKLSFNE